MNDDLPVDLLHHKAGGYFLQFENQPPVNLSPAVFAHLARQFVKEAHELREPLEPPYVVGLQVEYNVDGDQRTPHFTDAWAFATREEAQRFLELAQADVTKFEIQRTFDLSLPAVPEFKFWWLAKTIDADTALDEFRAICFEHFLYEVGESFWDSLSLAQRAGIKRIWEAGDWPNHYDPAELEAWVAGKTTLAEL